MIGVILLIYQGFVLALPDGKQFSVLHQNLAVAKAVNVDHMRRVVRVLSSDETHLPNL